MKKVVYVGRRKTWHSIHENNKLTKTQLYNQNRYSIWVSIVHWSDYEQLRMMINRLLWLYERLHYYYSYTSDERMKYEVVYYTSIRSNSK